MEVIVVANLKGGCSKSTLTAHLAVEAGEDVAIIDTDPQGSLSDWWNEREAETPSFATTTVAGIPAKLAELKKSGCRYVFIDTPPAITNGLVSIVDCASLVIVPARPSPHDLRAVGATIELLEPSGKPFVFVVASANKRAKLTGQAAIALSQHGKVAPSIIGHRQDFASSMIDGRVAGELNPNSPSASEIEELWVYVTKQLSK